MRAIQFQYQTKDSPIWHDTDAPTLMYDLLPSGIAVEYRVNPACVFDLNAEQLEGAKP